MLMLILCIWGIQLYYLMQVQKLEDELHQKKVELDNNVKLFNQKVIEYDKKLDLVAIRKNAEAKGMKVAEEIKYFEVSE